MPSSLSINATSISRFLWLGDYHSVRQIKVALDAKATELSLDAGDYTIYSAPAGSDPGVQTINVQSVIQSIQAVLFESHESESEVGTESGETASEDAAVLAIGRLWKTAAARFA